MTNRFSKIAGFTLAEIVIVIVVLSILALGTTRYIVTSSESFVVSAERARLIATGRVAVEQVTRRLRNALPNSIRLSSSGRCLEFFPVDAGTATTAPVTPLATFLDTPSFTLRTAGTHYAVIGGFSINELYNSNLPSPGVIAATGLMAAGDFNSIPLARPGGHMFSRTSPTQRVYVVLDPQRFCVTGDGELVHYTGYGISDTHPISDIAPVGANISLMVQNLVNLNQSFVFTPGALTRNALVSVNLTVSQGDESVFLDHQVQIRNVP